MSIHFFYICLLVYLFQLFDLLLLLFNLFCKVFHTLLIYFISCLRQYFSRKHKSMERELLKNKRPSAQIATECLLKSMYFFHSLDKLFTWSTSNLLSQLVWFVDFEWNFVYWNLHSLGKQLSFVFVEILRLYLSLLYIIPVIAHMGLDEP